MFVAHYAYRRRTAGFHAGKHGIGRSKTAQFPVHFDNGATHRFRHKIRQHCGKVGKPDAGAIRRINVSDSRRNLFFQKIADQLRRRPIIAAAGSERGLFQTALKIHSCQRMRTAKIPRLNPDQQSRVGVFPVAGKLTHAIGNHPSRLGCRRDDHAARTHTESVGRTSVVKMSRQLVISRSQCRMSCKPAVLRRINRFLDMFNSYPDRKRLLFNIHTVFVQHFKSVACTVSHRQYQPVRRLFVNFAVRRGNF